MRAIFLDWGYYLHKSIFSRQDMPSSYVCLRMIIGDLRKIGIRKDDIVIAAVDNHSGKNWRKTIDPVYKGDRAQRRADSGIDWKKEYQYLDELKNKLDVSTPIHFISLCTTYNNQLCSIEADDIMAVGCTFFKDKDVILLSVDKDLEQLYVYKNVKIFSPITKHFKVVPNPEKVLTQKILGKEVSDNLHNIVKSEVEYEKRKKIVSLLELPEQIFDCCEKALDTIGEKCYDISLFPNKKLVENFKSAFHNNGMTYEDSVKYLERKKKLNKIKKEKKKQLNLFDKTEGEKNGNNMDQSKL